MLTFNNKINSTLVYPIYEPYNKNEIIFIDIETTGFSAKTSFVYLIGCMYYESDSWYLIQWLLMDPKKEVDLLNALSNKLKPYKCIIHYNGSGFDIPFLTDKYRTYDINEPFSCLDSFDLYKQISPYRKLLPFPNLKFQTLQKYLGFERTDKNSGGDLIDVYASYLGRLKYENLASLDNQFYNKSEFSKNSTSKELADILLLHNHEDIAGFLEVSAILTYIDFLDRGISNSDIIHINSETQQEQLYINIKVHNNYPYEIKWLSPFDTKKRHPSNNTTNATYNANEKYSITIKNNHIYIKAPIVTDKLKYFFDNYKEYYYLPKEDMAIHKSVAMYVDKDHRTKASPSNCYTYLEARFIPVFDPKFLEEKEIKKFKYDYNTSTYFVELDKIIKSKEYIILWINSLLTQLKLNKNSVIV